MGGRLMPTEHEVEEGDSVISLSEEYGFFANTIWNDPDNAELKKKRKDMNILMPGDVVVIREKRLKEVEKPTAKQHVFRRKGIPALYRLQVFDVEKPRANQQYRLTVDGQLYEGRTDAHGVLQQYIPANSRDGELVIGPDEFRALLQFGYLDPINELSGVQKRLNNIGYDCGEADGQLNPQTKSALRDFQRRFELPQTGEPDESTLAQLEELHDYPTEFPREPQASIQ
jgi:Putative peptidoglycan binding domain